MQVGDIVITKNQEYPECLEGTPDGKIFYKVLEEDPGGRLHLKVFYLGRWRQKGTRKVPPGSCGYGYLDINKNGVRFATEEEKRQLAMARFME